MKYGRRRALWRFDRGAAGGRTGQGARIFGLWVLDRAIAFELVVLTLDFGAARHLKCNAGQALGGTAALPVDDQHRKRVMVWEVSTLMRYRS